MTIIFIQGCKHKLTKVLSNSGLKQINNVVYYEATKNSFSHDYDLKNYENGIMHIYM